MEEIEKINSNYNYSYNRIKEALDKLKDLIDTKQAALTAGDNITIADGVISATDTTYTAGSGISISAGNEISATASGKVYKHTLSFFDGQGNVITLVIYTSTNTQYSLLDFLSNPNKFYNSLCVFSSATSGVGILISWSENLQNLTETFMIDKGTVETITLQATSFQLTDTVTEL